MCTQHSRNAVLYQPHGICWCWRAANPLTTQAISDQHCNWQHDSGYQLANISAGCPVEQGKVCHGMTGTYPRFRACQHVLLTASTSLRLVVVLEKRTLVHDLKTLELLRTLETESNPKVRSGIDVNLACSSAVTPVNLCSTSHVCCLLFKRNSKSTCHAQHTLPRQSPAAETQVASLAPLDQCLILTHTYCLLDTQALLKLYRKPVDNLNGWQMHVCCNRAVAP